ncbi:MAG: hypothetical protein JRI68_34425, partial [Deltaproteobacteria bacterium]|nr:hypothetical protein [Deltaproteobacteria bacterium]
TPCGSSDDLVCSSSGICAGCNTPADCDGKDAPCAWRTCIAEQCGVAQASNGTSCTDDTFCNGNDTCNDGSCSQHAGDPCAGPDGDGDCSETCREAQEDCNGIDVNGAICDDGTFCNGPDTCYAGNCSQHAGNPCDGADGDGDCSETCREGLADCNGDDPNGSACDDGAWCNGSDTCNNGTCAQHTGDPCPGPDGDGNCQESCREGQDDCLGGDGTGAVCDDGFYCNGADTCVADNCSQHSGDPCPGPDGDSDCSEMCNEAYDQCSDNDPNGSSCPGGGCIGGLCTPDS